MSSNQTLLKTSVNNKISFYQSLLSSFPELMLVEDRIRKSLLSDVEKLTEISSYLLDLGGKRIRPLLSLVTHKMLSRDKPSVELIDAAAGVELIHMATLLHDDIIDRSLTRRKKASAYAEYGMADTLLTGDFLLVRAFGLCAKLSNYIIRETEIACVELTEGEILEGKISTDKLSNLEEYFRVISKKTASLFRLSCGIGAFSAKVSLEDLKKAEELGKTLGMCFQIIDDILDITADESVLGKPIGADLREKTPSLVNVLWSREQPEQAKKFFELSSPDKKVIEEAIRTIKSSNSIKDAKSIAESYSKKSLEILDSLDSSIRDSESKHILLEIINHTLDRIQ